jgi:hypothetical protein
MVEEARLRGFDPVDDNEADALALLHKRLIEGPPTYLPVESLTPLRCPAAVPPLPVA